MPRRSSRLASNPTSTSSGKQAVQKSTLPPEIMAQIVQEVAYGHYSYGLTKFVRYKTLRRLCLVSKAWLPAARSALYNLIFLEYKDGLDEDDEELEYEYYYASDDEYMDEPIQGDPILPPETPPFRDQALLTSLRRYPHLRPLVRGLIVTYSFKKSTNRMEDADPTLSELFRLCSRITRLGLRNGPDSLPTDTAELASALSNHASNHPIEELEMPWTGPGCGMLLEATPELRRLVLTEDQDTWSSEAEQFTSGSFEFNLRELRVDWLPKDISVNPLLLAKASSTISSLEVRLPILLRISTDIPCITSFTLHFSRSPLSQENTSKMIAALEHFPSLLILRLVDLALPSTEVAPPLLRLPPALTLLSMKNSQIEKQAILQYLQELPPRQGFSLEVKRRMRGSKEVRQACRKGGIKLV